VTILGNYMAKAFSRRAKRSPRNFCLDETARRIVSSIVRVSNLHICFSTFLLNRLIERERERDDDAPMSILDSSSAFVFLCFPSLSARLGGMIV